MLGLWNPFIFLLIFELHKRYESVGVALIISWMWSTAWFQFWHSIFTLIYPRVQPNRHLPASSPSHQSFSAGNLCWISLSTRRQWFLWSGRGQAKKCQIIITFACNERRISSFNAESDYIFPSLAVIAADGICGPDHAVLWILILAEESLILFFHV